MRHVSGDFMEWGKAVDRFVPKIARLFELSHVT